MDFEKKYRDLVKAVKELQEANLSDEGIQKWIEDNVPELAEPEDERIRKSLIDWFSDKHAADDFRGIAWERIVAWLEKQGEYAKFYDSIQVGDKVTRNRDGMLVNLSQLKRVAKPADKAEPKDYSSIDPHFSKPIEQKPADEPKFKVGDWLVHKNINGVFCIMQIASNYYLTNKNSFIKFGEEDNYRPWTIQDAKDGDVLVNDAGCIFIYKNYMNDIVLRDYCHLSTVGYIVTENDNEGGYTHITNVYPATKEQRDLLFKKMHEVGYEWDAEKKELKKIEQTSANETPYPETLEKAIDLYYYSYGNGKGEFEHLSLEKFRDIVHTFVSDYGQKPAWSEEDKKMSRFIGNSITANDASEYLESKGIQVIDAHVWLENLKERYTWKPSDEQIIELRRVISGCSYDIEPLVELEEQLKKLKG